MDFKLTKEKRVFHNCNDERMIEWCINHLEGRGGDQEGKYGFGCECDENHTLDEKYRLGIRIIHHEDDDWEEWMYEINDTEIRVYFCDECQSWAIDDDQ